MTKQFALQQSGGNRGAIHLHKGAILATAAVVNRPRNQFLSSSGFTKKQDCGVIGSHRFDQFEHMPKSGTVADDVFKIHLAADLFFQIHLFPREFILQIGNLLVGQSIFNGDRNLTGYLREEVNVFWGKRAFAGSSNGENSQCSTMVDQRNQAVAFQPFSHRFVPHLSRNLIAIKPVDDHRF